MTYLVVSFKKFDNTVVPANPRKRKKPGAGETIDRNCCSVKRDVFGIDGIRKRDVFIRISYVIGANDLSNKNKNSFHSANDALLQPDGDKAFYENLPFHGMQNPPNKVDGRVITFVCGFELFA